MKEEDPTSFWEIKDPDPEDRIQARRARIANRIKTAKKLQKLIKAQHVLGHVSTRVDGSKTEELPPVKIQCERSKSLIEEALENGRELVSNVPLASQHVQAQHRFRTEERSKSLKDLLNKEDEETAMVIKGIQEKWNMADNFSKGEPVKLYEEIVHQNQACNDLLRKRNDLIELIESEIQDSDNEYKVLVDEFHENITVLASRMEQQIQTLEKLVSFEWDKMERTFQNQRETLFRKKDFAWCVKLETLNRAVKDKLNQRLDLLHTQEKEIDEIIANDAEVYGELKTETENSVAELTDQIHMLDAVHQLNEEKLDYEIHVLKKHEEENVLVKSEQKRKIAILQDTISKLRGKISENKSRIKSEESSLSSGILQTQDQLKMLDGKRKTLTNQFKRKNKDISEIVKAEIQSKLQKISQMDHLLSKMYGPCGNPRAIEIDLTYRGSNISSSSLFTGTSNSSSSRKEIVKIYQSKMTDEGVKNMLSDLVEEAYFLVEEDLDLLVDSIPENERSLFKLDSILNVLGVKGEDEILQFLRQADSESSISSLKTSILKILRQFVEKKRVGSADSSSEETMQRPNRTGSDFLDKRYEDDEEWKHIKSLMDTFAESDNLKLKDPLYKYLIILKQRNDIMKKNEKLLRVNEELSTILIKAQI